MHPATVIAMLSLLVSGGTLWFTQFAPADIESYVGPKLQVWYEDQNQLQLLLPVTFINRSSTPGTVRQVALTLHRDDAPDDRFFMPWDSFQRVDTSRFKWVYDEIAHALAVPEKASVNKVVAFHWPADAQSRLLLQHGKYALHFHYWAGDASSPETRSHEFMISPIQHQRLEDERRRGQKESEEFSLDRNVTEHRAMTEREFSSLLGQ